MAKAIRRNPADAPRSITVAAAKKREAALEKRINRRIAKLAVAVARLSERVDALK